MFIKRKDVKFTAKCNTSNFVAECWKQKLIDRVTGHENIPPPFTEGALRRSDDVVERVVDEAVVFVVSVHVFHPIVPQVGSASCHRSENLPEISLVGFNMQV